MNEKRTFKKRLAGLFAMALVLAMMMGMTVNAAGTAYHVYCAEYAGPGLTNWGQYAYTLCTDEGYGTSANVSTLSGEDTITVELSGKLNIYLDGTQKTQLNANNRTYAILDGTYTYTIERVGIQEGTLKLTTYNPAPTDEQCSHGGKYSKVIKEPTETEDGIIGWFCENCGERVGDEVGANSSYALFLKNIINKINNAEAGSTVEIKSEVWNTLTQEVMLALQARRDIHVVLILPYQNEDYQYVIPAGTAFDTSEMFYGPLYLGQLFGMTKLEK